MGEDLFSKSGGNFPYRRYIAGTSDNISKLRFLIEEYIPKYDKDGFDKSKLEYKVKSLLPPGMSVFDFFSKGPKNIANDFDWYYNSVIDQYTETARMSSPGYGKNYSPEELWFKTSFSKIRDKIFKNKTSLEEAREAIFKEGEVRLAYVTDCVGLYNYVKTSLLKKTSQPPRVIDITAFGDRLVAAAATGFDYIGLDPDPNLVDGISRLLLDIKTVKPSFNANTYTIPLEHFTCETEVDFVSFSPPPYSAEPYSGGDRQVHKVYTDFRHWFYGFIREALIRAFFWLKEGGILGFTVLDRDGPYKIFYTEAMILLAIKLGFRPVSIFTLSSSAGTPWWLFQKDSSFKNTDSDLFMKYYSNLFLTELSHVNTPAMEYIRYLCSGYLVNTCLNANLFARPEKAKETVGRILMSKTPLSEDPDPLFPDDMSEIITTEEDFNAKEQIRYPIVIQTPDPGYRTIIMADKDRTGSQTFLEICNSIVSYLHWIQCTVEFDNFQKCLKSTKVDRMGKSLVSLTVDRRDELSTISFLRKRTLFVKESLDSIKCFPKFISLWSSMDTGINISNINSYLRYASVGLIGHHFTRPDSRINAIAEISKLKSKDEIVDLFSTPFNNNSKLYASVYPDVDQGSLGNFFTYHGGSHRVLMANPPPYKGFDEKMLDRLINVYLQGKTIFYSTTVWGADGSEYLTKIREGMDPQFDSLDIYYVLTMLWKYYKKYIKAVYILDYNTHPTFDGARGQKFDKRRDSESVGVIISDDEFADLDLSKLSLLSKGAHVIY